MKDGNKHNGVDTHLKAMVRNIVSSGTFSHFYEWPVYINQKTLHDREIWINKETKYYYLHSKKNLALLMKIRQNP